MPKLTVEKMRESEYAKCPFCDMTVKRRGLRMHQRSQTCEAFRLAITAEQKGLTRLDSAGERFFRDKKFKLHHLATGVHDRRARTIRREDGTYKPMDGFRAKVINEPWGCKVAYETLRVCFRVKQEKMLQQDEELDKWMEACVRRAITDGVMSDEVKVADSIQRLSDLPEGMFHGKKVGN